MTFYTASKCFSENCQLIDPRQEPVMWNLYNGLSAMAQNLADLEQRISRIEHALDRLQSQIQLR